MPYIKDQRRAVILTKNATSSGWRRKIQISEIKTAGELNYAITMAIQEFLRNSPGNYQAINDVVGALEGAKLEFYRRKVVPYEDAKIEENGDVY